MYYLAKKLDDCFIEGKHIPMDIMIDIYQYTDTFKSVREQIENKQYDLEEIMYQKMKKWIEKNYFDKHYSYTVIDNDYNRYIVEKQNIDDPQLRTHLINDMHGYKDYFLWKHKRSNKICGLDPMLHGSYKYKMSEDLNTISSNIPEKSINEIYNEWLKL